MQNIKVVKKDGTVLERRAVITVLTECPITKRVISTKAVKFSNPQAKPTQNAVK